MTVQSPIAPKPGGCATVGWDDEGVAATSYPIVDKGVFVNYQSATRDMVGWTSSISPREAGARPFVRPGLVVDSVSAHAEREPAAGGAQTSPKTT